MFIIYDLEEYEKIWALNELYFSKKWFDYITPPYSVYIPINFQQSIDTLVGVFF